MTLFSYYRAFIATFAGLLKYIRTMFIKKNIPCSMGVVWGTAVRCTMAVVMDFKRNDLHVLVVDFHVVMGIQDVVAASLCKLATGKMIAMYWIWLRWETLCIKSGLRWAPHTI